jgi:glycosyltransferase involved in cell wall biosynthesis
VSVVLDRIVPVVGARRLDSREALSSLRAHRGPVHLHTSLRRRAFFRDTVLAVAARGPLIVSWHGWDPDLARRIERGAARIPFALGLGRARAHLVLTDEQRAALIRWGVDPARIAKVRNPIDPVDGATERVPGPPTALFLGRLDPSKGVAELVRAFARAAAEEPDLRLVVAGEGPARAEVVAEIGRSGAPERVALAGWVGPVEKRRLLARSAVLALPSRGEAFPLAVAEALAADLPVVATRTGAVPELVGHAGILVPSPDPELLAGALLRAVRAPPPPAGERIRAWCAPEAVARGWREAWALAVSTG